MVAWAAARLFARSEKAQGVSDVGQSLSGWMRLQHTLSVEWSRLRAVVRFFLSDTVAAGRRCRRSSRAYGRSLGSKEKGGRDHDARRVDFSGVDGGTSPRSCFLGGVASSGGIMILGRFRWLLYGSARERWVGGTQVSQ